MQTCSSIILKNPLKLLTRFSSCIEQEYWLEPPDGKAMKYDLRSIKLDVDYIKLHAFTIARDQIGVVQENPNYANLHYCNPPDIQGTWKEQCLLTAKEDAILHNIVRPEFITAFIAAFSEEFDDLKKSSDIVMKHS